MINKIYIFFVLLIISSLNVSIMSSQTNEVQDISGLWIGTLYQPSGGSQTIYPFEMNITQTGTTINGTSTIEADGDSYGIMELSGTVSNDTFSFEEIRILGQVTPPGFRWCIKYGELDIDNDGLLGSWAAPECIGGKIVIKRAGDYVPGIDPQILDVNRDNRITPVDAIYVINRIGQDPLVDTNADVNSDGNITEEDVDAILGSIGLAVTDQ